MEALIPLVALVSLGLLAMRFGADSRPAMRSDEHRLAHTGMTWDSTSRPTEPADDTPTSPATADAPLVKRLVWAPTLATQSGSTASPFSTLQAIDLARDPYQPAFATDPNAAQLERRARQLTDQYWSGLAWLTGYIDQSRFDTVCDALERDRQAWQRLDEAISLEQPSLNRDPSKLAWDGVGHRPKLEHLDCSSRFTSFGSACPDRPRL